MKVALDTKEPNLQLASRIEQPKGPWLQGMAIGLLKGSAHGASPVHGMWQQAPEAVALNGQALWHLQSLKHVETRELD